MAAAKRSSGNQIIIHAGKIESQQLVLDPVTLFFFDASTRFVSRIDAQAAKRWTATG